MTLQRECSLRLTRRYAALPAEVWRALTEPEALARWLGRADEVELAEGGAFVVTLPEGDRVDGRVRELEPERVLELDWRRAGEDVSFVRFELREEAGGTILVLDHSRIDEQHGMASLARWERALQRLEGAIAA